MFRAGARMLGCDDDDDDDDDDVRHDRLIGGSNLVTKSLNPEQFVVVSIFFSVITDLQSTLSRYLALGIFYEIPIYPIFFLLKGTILDANAAGPLR